MIYDVTVSLYEPVVSREDQVNVLNLLNGLGFSQKVTTNDERSLDLPVNMYMGKFEGESLKKVRDDLSASLKDELAAQGIKNRFMLIVSPPLAWGIRNT